PDYVRKDRNYQYFFVNQRWVKVPALTKILEDLYADLVPKRHYPVAILNLQLPPETVDVNVHPTKREVRFKNFSLIYQLLKEALAQALERYHPERTHLVDLPKPAPELLQDLPQEPVTSGPDQEPPPWPSDERPPFAPTSSKPPPFSAAPDPELPPFARQTYAPPSPAGLPLAETPPAYGQAPPTNSPAGSRPEALTLPGLSPIEQLQRLQASGADTRAPEQALLESIVPVGQVCENTYIIGSFGRDLVLIDQHVAEERHLYEALLEKGELVRQPLLVSVILELDAIDRGLLEAHSEIFTSAGFEYEAYGPETIAIRTLPHCLRYADAEVAFKALLADLRETGVADSRLEAYKRVCKTIACHSAIRAGDPLSLEQIREIVRNWARTKNPYTCPHGRPILLKLSKDEINRRFLRSWS
ncbi:MAG TPA: hypothetical protein V6D23_09430, partial [Candidatus Obscuribacterales bacterium]